MSPNALGVLKSLALGPSHSVAANVMPIILDLHRAGYVTYDESGWIASAAGCQLLAQHEKKKEPTASAAVVGHGGEPRSAL